MPRTTPTPRRGDRSAFTLAEVLAALLFLAIVIPVAIEGLRVASRAGLVAERKATAARIAERVLNELLVTGNWQSGLATGTESEGANDYRWSLDVEPWEWSSFQVLSVDVFFQVQDREYDVRLSTLADPSAGATSITNSAPTSSTGGTAGGAMP